MPKGVSGNPEQSAIAQLQDRILELENQYKILPDKTATDKLITNIIQNLAVAYVTLGKQYFNDKEFDEAVTVLEKALALPQNQYTDNALRHLAATHNDLGARHLKAKEFDEAVTVLEKAYSLLPDKTSTDKFTTTLIRNLTAAYDNLGKQHLKAKEFDEAVTVLEKAYSLLPDKTSTDKFTTDLIKNLAIAYDNLGKQHFEAEDFNKAVIAFEKSYALPPNPTTDANIRNLVAAYNCLGEQYLEAKEFDKTISVLKQALDLPPNINTNNTIQNLANAYIGLGKQLLEAYDFRPKEASEAFEQAYTLPKNLHTDTALKNLTVAYRALGMQYFTFAKFKEAAEALEQAYALLPDKTSTDQFTTDLIKNLATAYVNLGKQYFDDKNFGEAVTSFEKAYALLPNPKTDASIHNLAITYTILGLQHFNADPPRFEEAVTSFEKAYALSLNTNTDTYASLLNLVDAYVNLGGQLLWAGRYDEAVIVLEKACDLPPNPKTDALIKNLANTYDNLGARHLKAEEFDKAITIFKKACALPENPRAHFFSVALNDTYTGLAEKLEAVQKFKEAVSLLEKVYIDDDILLAPDDLMSRITKLHTAIATKQKDFVTDISSIDKVLSRSLDVSSTYNAEYKQIIVNYHNICCKNLAEALAINCKKSKVEDHLNILQESLTTALDSSQQIALSKQITYIYLNLAKHYGDLSYLSHVDESLLTSEELKEINAFKADVYFEKADKYKHDKDFEKTIEFLEKYKALKQEEPEKAELLELSKDIYLKAAMAFKGGDPEKAFEYFKKAKAIDKDTDLMTDPVNKELAYEITINLAKVSMLNNHKPSILKAIKCLSESEKHRKSPDTSKLKIECYLKLSYGEFQDHYLEKATEVLATLELDYTTDLYVTQICTRYLRTEDEEETAEEKRELAKALLPKIQDSTIKEALENIIKGDTRYAAACEKVNNILSRNTDLSKVLANELLPLIPQGIVDAVNKNKSSPELVTQKAVSEESLEHEKWQAHKRMLKLDDEAYKKFKTKESDTSREAVLTWNINDAKYRWEGYTDYEKRKEAVYEITPGLFAMIDPKLDLGIHSNKFYAALMHGMATAGFGTKGVKVLEHGFELKILGAKRAGDTRLVASKIYSCKTEAAPHEHRMAAAATSSTSESKGSSHSKAKAKSSPKFPSASSDEETVDNAQELNAFKLILFDTWTHHEEIESGIGQNPDIVPMSLTGDGWHV